MKTYFKLLLFIILAFSLSLLSFWHLSRVSNPELAVKSQATEVLLSLPVRLLIPAISVDAKIQSLGTNSKGEMEAPSNITDVGLYKFGVIPGQTGSAVIAGHFNGESNQEGVFANLNKLKVGDKLFIENEAGKTITFIVQRKELYDSGFMDDVFNQSDSAHLNLITCDGLWNEAKKSYTKRLVIFSDILDL